MSYESHALKNESGLRQAYVPPQSSDNSTPEGSQRADNDRSILEDHQYRKFRSQAGQRKHAAP